MRRRHALVLAALAVAAAAPAYSAEPHWVLEKTVPLGPPDRWDFVALDSSGGRVYVAHEDKVSIADAAKGRVVGILAPMAGVHDVVVVPSLGRIYADNGISGTVSVFDSKTLRRIGEIPAKPDTDAMAYDPAAGVLVVADGDSGYATLIDPKADKAIATVPIGPGAEGIALDGTGHAFINISDAGEMVRLDLKRAVVDKHWSLKGCKSPHGLAIDRAAGRLFVTCRNRRMFVVNSLNGAIVARLPIGRGTDGAAFDPRRKLAFSSNKEGTVSVIAELGSDHYKSLPAIRTSPGAATMAEDPKSGCIYVVTAMVNKRLPPHHGGEVPEYQYHPGSARLLVYEPDR